MSRVWGAVRAALTKSRETLGPRAANLKERLPKQPITKAVAKYEAFTGVQEVRDLQKNVVAAQEKFTAAQEKRRQAGEKLMEVQQRVKAIHDEMQTVSKGDPNYLKLITEEHKIIVDEGTLRNEFAKIEREERDYFNVMTAAVKLSHETERIYAEKNKYLYLVASIVGTVLGVLGSTINNKMKMKEFKEMIMEERSGSRLWNLNFSEGNTQKKLQEIESRVVAISTNQKTILDYLIKTEKMIETQFGNTKHLINVNMTQKSSHSKSNKQIDPIPSVVQPTEEELYTNDIEQWKSTVYFAVGAGVAGYLLGKAI